MSIIASAKFGGNTGRKALMSKSLEHNRLEAYWIANIYS